jgi:hypothetical protein
MKNYNNNNKLNKNANMAKIFKGFKQVSSAQFEAAQKVNALDGYIWFVRTAVLKGEETADLNDVANDSYDIYFGSRHYGHFCEGEIQALENAINEIRTDLGFEFGQFELGENVNTVKGAFDAIVDMLGTLTDSVSANTESIGTLTDSVSANTESIENINTELEAKANKVELDVKADKTDLEAKADKADLEAKADKTDLEAKANKTDLEAKADKADLEAKADKADLEAKADKTDLADYITEAAYEGNAILFKNAAGETITQVDATPFVKDGILEDVEVVEIKAEDIEEGNPNNLVVGEKYIKFTWNADGENKVDYILTSEIGATYSGSESIEISNNNQISVKAVEGEKVNVEEIPVGGTPLADILTAKGINTINAGNLQAVLESLFSKEDWPTAPARNVPAADSVKASQSKPNASFNKTTAKVGERVSITASTATATGSATVSYSGFTYGYSAENDNTKDGDTPASVTKNIEHTSGNYGLTATITSGFTSSSIPEDAVTTSETSASLGTTYLVVNQGANKVKVQTSTPNFSITIPKEDMPEYYACSTLKKTSDEHKVAAATENVVYENLNATASTEVSVTGVYPIYTNAVWAVNPTTANFGDGQSSANTAYNATGSTSSEFSEKLTSLTNGNTVFYAFIAFGNGGFTIKLPKGWKIDAAQTKSDTKTGTFDGNQGIPTPTVDEVTVVDEYKEDDVVVVPATKADYNIYNFNIAASNVIRLRIIVDNNA